MKMKLVSFLLLLAATVVLANCAQNPVTGNPNLVLMSEEQEVAIGKREDANVRKQYSPYADAALQRYVSEIGQRLAKASHRPGIEYSFLVVDSPEVNAFALPGGYIYITRGILAYLNSEAELAAVLGHELRHALERLLLAGVGDEIKADALPIEILEGKEAYLAPGAERRPTLADVERRYIELTLAYVRGNQTRAAAILGISRKALWEKRKRFGLR